MSEKKTEEEVVSESSVADEIGEMLGRLTGEIEETSTEDSSDEVEDDSVETPVEEESAEEEEEEVEEEEAPAETPAEEPDERDQEIADLRQRLAEKETPAEEEEEEEVPVAEELTFEPQDFMGDLEIDDVLADKESINELLNKVFQQGVRNSRDVVGEHILRDIPQIVKTNIALITEMSAASEKFYSEHKDLEPFKKVVATVFEEVQAENPDKGYEELLDTVGKEARKRLELHKETITPVEEKAPRLPAKKGSRTVNEQPDTSPLEDELSDMTKVVRR